MTDMLTISQAARVIGVSRSTIKQAIERTGPNQLPATHTLLAVHALPVAFIARADLEAWDARRPAWAKRRTRERAPA